MKSYKINEINNKRILGRTSFYKDSLALFWGASALEINVHAKEVWINISSDYDTYESWIAVEINGYETNRFMAPKEEQWICIARNLNPEKENLISIIKDTQAMSGDNHHVLFINAVGLDDAGTFLQLKSRSMKMEFIGDSITSGEGLAGHSDEMDWITQWFCASKTYAMQVAKEMNADWSVISQCGWGISWGWDGNINSKIPPHYTKVCSLLNSDFQKSFKTTDEYDFKNGSDWVVVNLGTNDNTGVSVHASGQDINVVYDDVKAFLKVIRSKNPAAKILWVWGMISLDKIPRVVSKAIKDYKAENKDDFVFSMELPSMGDVEKTEKDKGSRGHPGPRTHEIGAQAIIDFIKSN